MDSTYSGLNPHGLGGGEITAKTQNLTFLQHLEVQLAQT